MAKASGTRRTTSPSDSEPSERFIEPVRKVAKAPPAPRPGEGKSEKAGS